MNHTLFHSATGHPRGRALTAALATGFLLLIPLTAMQYSDDVAWTAGDFLAGALILYPTCLAALFILSRKAGPVYRLALTAALASAFLLLWANLAVGLIGAGGHWGNWLYAGVFAVAGFGAWRSRLKPAGMAATQWACVLALAGIAVIALLAGMQHYPGSATGEILAVNGFFAGLFAVSALLFRLASRRQGA